MGTSYSGFELANKLQNLERHLTDGARDGVRAGGELVQDSIDAQLAIDVPTRRLQSGAKHGRSTGRALSTHMDDMRQQPDNPAVMVTARGPWQVFERPTSPHVIMAKGFRRDVGRALRGLQQGAYRRSRSTRSRVMALKNGHYAPHVRHPGTRGGKHTFEKGATRVLPLVPGLVDKEIHQAMARVF